MKEALLGEDIFRDGRQEVAQDWFGQQGASNWMVGCMASGQPSVMELYLLFLKWGWIELGMPLRTPVVLILFLLRT